MRVSLYRLQVPSVFCGRAVFDRDTNTIFPQGALAVFTLVRDGAGKVGARAGTRYEAGTPLCSVASVALSGVGSDSKLLEQEALKVQPWLVLFPLSVCFSLFQHQHACPTEGQC